MGDKTQIATIALAAHYAAPLLVIAGTIGHAACRCAWFSWYNFAEKIRCGWFIQLRRNFAVMGAYFSASG
jgi:putative Ca2+/H+ antiporter (TMEM165/GDT1 family)